ncbi:MAG: DMT family transporter [Gemmatimonadota bacterium]
MGSEGLLLLAAAIWGFAFAAQRAGMAHVGPFLFNGLRFALGCLPLLPFLSRWHRQEPAALSRAAVARGVGLGAVLFAAASLQQVGIVHTTAGKAGFITGLYVVLVPLFGLAIGHRAGPWAWAGATVAAVGLYLLSAQADLRMEAGDLLVLACAAVWAVHVLLVDRLVRQVHWSLLAFTQFATCAALSLGVAALSEPASAAAVGAAAWPLLYAGALSVGVGYTLQVVGQRGAPPAPAAIILSLEAVFAALGGWLVLGEQLSSRELAGCALMLAGMVASQLAPPKKLENE